MPKRPFRKRETPEEHARVVEKTMRHVYARQDEDRAAEAAAAPPPDASTRQRLRALVDKWDAEADESGDGDNAA